jgi:activator of 2-hydroxyglutaryl-CoA dehydratase
VKKSDILAALHEAISVRVYSLLKQVGIEKEFVITGGIARNIGVVRRVADKVGLTPLVPPDPQMMGALGAALFAKEAVKKAQAKSIGG